MTLSSKSTAILICAVLPFNTIENLGISLSMRNIYGYVVHVKEPITAKANVDRLLDQQQSEMESSHNLAC